MAASTGAARSPTRRPTRRRTRAPLSLFALAPDTPTTDLHAGDPQPALFYAADGNIVGLDTGETITFNPQLNLPTIFVAAKSVRIEAGGDGRRVGQCGRHDNRHRG